MLPPFSRIQPAHYKPAFDEAMKTHLAELQAIVDNPASATFENTLVPYDHSAALLTCVGEVFGNMCRSLNTPELQVVQTEMVPVLSRHRSATYTFPGLFERIRTVHDARASVVPALNSEQLRLVERVYMDFTRAGAMFDQAAKAEYADLLAEQATLETQFQQNVMKDEELFTIVLKLEDLAGCPEGLVQAAKQAASDCKPAKADDEYVITLSRSLVEPFLTFCDRRDLRKTAWEAWTKRGELSPDRNNQKIAEDILKLRRKQAQYHGYQNFAQYQCTDMMAKTPGTVTTLLEKVWARAKVSANREREALEAFVRASGVELEGGIQPWDWRYFAEKVRKQNYSFDESLLKPYLSLDTVTAAMMSVSQRLYGLRYIKRPDIQSYHPDVDTYEVRETLPSGEDKLVAIFIHDNFARPYKSSGAWMSEYRMQKRNLPAGASEMQSIPIVSNNNNFAKGTPCLLSFDDATTLFHEAGHGHHGMLSSATYGRLASTNVLTDFVELPSQLMEHWLRQPAVLREYAKHYETGEVVPDALLEKLMAARVFNMGFATIEYTACALVDMAMHQLEDYSAFDLLAFEKAELERLGMPQGIVMRHRPCHFQHLFSSSHYAAGYYVYLWAEVLDADCFAAFEETGDIFDPATAQRARKFIYSAGNTQAPDELFRQFRGRDPEITFMLKKKNLE
jgi:peptidyl-dipeptidase Dcp